MPVVVESSERFLQKQKENARESASCAPVVTQIALPQMVDIDQDMTSKYYKDWGTWSEITGVHPHYGPCRVVMSPVYDYALLVTLPK